MRIMLITYIVYVYGIVYMLMLRKHKFFWVIAF